MTNCKYDDVMVTEPPHYKSGTGLEAIDVIEAFTSHLQGIEATDTGNILKYACRWKKKNGIQDLKKIVWYAEHLIRHLEKTTMVAILDVRSDDTWDCDWVLIKRPYDVCYPPLCVEEMAYTTECGLYLMYTGDYEEARNYFEGCCHHAGLTLVTYDVLEENYNKKESV